MESIASNSQLLSNDVLAKGLIEDFPFRIQLAQVLPFYPISGHALRYANTPALKPGVALDFNESIPVDTKHPNDCNRVFPIAELATQFRIAYKAQDVFSSNVNDQTAVQMKLAIRELLYRFWILFETGDATKPGEFDGLQQLVDPGQVLDLNYQTLTLEALDEAKEMVRSNNGRGIVMFTSSLGKRAIHAAHWQRGVTPHYHESWVPCPCECPDEEDRYERFLSFDGAPVYINDLSPTVQLEHSDEHSLPPEPAQAANIWLFTLGKNHLHGIIPDGLESGQFITRSTLLPDGSSLVYHVTMPVAIALGSRASLAVIRNATLPGNHTVISKQGA